MLQTRHIEVLKSDTSVKSNSSSCRLFKSVEIKVEFEFFKPVVQLVFVFVKFI